MPRSLFTSMDREAQRRASRRRLRERIANDREARTVQAPNPWFALASNVWRQYETTPIWDNNCNLGNRYRYNTGITGQYPATDIAQYYPYHNPGIGATNYYTGTTGQFHPYWNTGSGIQHPAYVAQHPSYVAYPSIHAYRHHQNFDEIREHFMSAVQELEQTVNRCYAEDIWRNWTVTASQSEGPGDNWAVMLTATRHGRNEEPQDPWSNVWEEWVRGVVIPRPTEHMVPPRPSESEIRRRAASRAREALIRRNRSRAFQLHQRVAKRRARDLLLSMLTEEQRADLERANYFEVIAPGGSVYHVARGHAGNVYLVNDEGERVERYCIHAPIAMPDEDHMLSQKLLLETDEEEFRAIANRTPIHLFGG